jgi:hypothetical protein
MNDYTKAARDQGFDLSISDSPIDTPDGWTGGKVEQTGGFIMCRIWRTWERDGTKHRETEYECVYGENPGVSIVKYEWSEEFDGYAHVEAVEDRPVSDNSDVTKAEVAKEMMEEFSRED